MHNMQNMQGMNHNFAGMYLMQQASGTSMNPQSWAMPMIMKEARGWQFMFMGNAFLVETQQSGARGGDKFYSPNWFMVSASHSVGRGSFMIQTMLSAEPLTVTDRRYPLLFQTGETAFGRPIVDGQHPHNLVMGLGVHYARPVGGTIVHLYYAPVGDPAIGPVAFPHRASAFELPQAPLGHHWQDSTHIATNVITGAIKYRKFRLEASGFHGTEPGENRWTIHWAEINSYSGRFSVNPTRNWMFQVSAAKLVDPEREHPGDVTRITASGHYTRGGWSSSFVWGRSRDTNSWLAETLLPVSRRNIVTGRFEVVDKDELVPGHDLYRITAYTAGYTRDLVPQVGVGFNVTGYAIPQELKPLYGEHPAGVNVFLHFRVRSRS
jgi:hypothetical protein